jgi:hypothetical protein
VKKIKKKKKNKKAKHFKKQKKKKKKKKKKGLVWFWPQRSNRLQLGHFRGPRSGKLIVSEEQIFLRVNKNVADLFPKEHRLVNFGTLAIY